MSMHPFAAIVLACTASGLSAAVGQTPPGSAQGAPSQPYVPPRTLHGHPSLEGVWTHNFLILMEAASRTPELTVPEPAAKAMAAAIASGISAGFDKGLDPEVPELMRAVEGLPIVRGERRTRSVVEPADGKLPYSPEAREESQRGYGSGQADNPEERPNWERCVTSLGLPPVTGLFVTSANPREFIQTADTVVVHTEYGDEARIIPLTTSHRARDLHSVLGDSIARWEGATLVIETIGLPEKDRVRAFSNLIVPSTSTVIERYTRVSDDELLYQYTVVDPSTYTAPWLAEYSLYRTDQRMFEHACHEGNYSLPNILKAARMDEARAEPKGRNKP